MTSKGSLIGAPHMEEVPHFRKSDYPLHQVHADVWDGHIFLNLSRGPAAAAGSAWRYTREVHAVADGAISDWGTASSTTCAPTGSC